MRPEDKANKHKLNDVLIGRRAGAHKNLVHAELERLADEEIAEMFKYQNEDYIDEVPNDE